MKGVYLVFFRLNKKRDIDIGALGAITFPSDLYVYTGSAQRSAEKRIERHFSEPENLHWHIDYFSEEAEAVDYFFLPEDSSYECLMASILEDIGEPVKNFGSSDCDCNSHLFRLPLDFSLPDLNK